LSLLKIVARSKKILKPDCPEPAAKVIEQVLLARLKKMCALRERALAWANPEGVHDMRVASRRLRSAISDFQPYLPKDSLPLSKLKTIANHLGAVRDEDVVLAALSDLKSKADPDLRKGVEVIAREHRSRRKRARAELASVIGSDAIAEFRKEFRSKIREATRSSANDAGLTFNRVGVRVIGGRLKRLSKAGDSVYHPLKAKKLHKLRIVAKKLRYALELFAPCGGEELKDFADEIARFQTSLGELHDCDVWIDHLETRLKSNRKSPRPAGGQVWRDNDVAVWLLHHFANERTKHYCYALARWHKWENEGFLNRIKALLNNDFIAVIQLPQKRKRGVAGSN
jgi:CHAD domain-containing protein